VAIICADALASDSAGRSVSLAEENRRPGTAEWWQAPPAPSGAIEGYADRPSIVAGDTLGLCVSTRPAARYRTTVFRLGWYGGDGGRRMGAPAPNVGLARDAPLPDLRTGIVRAGWPVTDVVTSGESWVSGQYVAVLELIGGPHAGTATRIPFVVRALPGDTAPILVQTPVNTAQAYNHWGGRSLYESNSQDGIAAVKVSFDRPAPAWEQANLNARAPFVYELALIRWLEREGLEAAYQTDVDTHRHPHTLVGRRVFVVAGHDEYWTAEMRDAAETALAAGTGLAFMGANIAYWQVRYEDDERTLAEYRDAALDPETDPARQTVRFRDLDPPRPERTLIGQQYDGGLAHPRDELDFHFTPGFADDRWAAGVALEPDRPLRRLVGYEWDTFDPAAAPPGAVPILHADTSPAPADCLRWTAASGAQVFSAGSLALVWGLDDWPAPGCADARLQRVIRAGFAELLDGR
jgi:hypothetical protein